MLQRSNVRVICSLEKPNKILKEFSREHMIIVLSTRALDPNRRSYSTKWPLGTLLGCVLLITF